MLSSLGAFALTIAFPTVRAVTVGGFSAGGSTLVSAMMMFLGNENSVYILDKAENNAAQVNGHPAWGALWDIGSQKSVVMDVATNSFCASGMHLPNGSYVSFGGNSGVTTGGAAGSQKNPDGSGAWDSLYQDFDGRKSIRILNPCKITDSLNSGKCAWFDNPAVLSMKKQRWYSTSEPTGDGQVIIIGGMINGGYINRWLPNVDPVTEAGQAEPTYEYYPAVAGDPQTVNFIVRTSGLNAYPHAFLMASGKILLQANTSTALWDHVNNVDTPLPEMPGGVIRVYPASGATAMLPLTPANNWTPTLLFCGGSVMSDNDWGSYSGPNTDTWLIAASSDCQRLTPEPSDGSQPTYVQDDEMIEPRTMGQFVILPTGKLLLINGGQNGTAGYALGTPETPDSQMPFGRSLASAPVLRPVIYDPDAPQGSRWSTLGISPSQIPRLYHSSAILLPDGSIIVGGSNPNPDVNLSTFFNTEYRADIFYPPYFSANVRPTAQNVPQTLSYGGSSFDILVPSSSYSGDGNTAADVTVVTIVRSGFTTHGMNMGQRFMQLNNTYTVNQNGSITLHVAQLPPNPNLFQPGPALLFVCINGIPSTGTLLIVGNGVIGTQPTAAASQLPPSVRFDGSVTGTGPDTSTSGGASSKAFLVAGIAGAVVLLGLIAAVTGVCIARKKRALAEKSNYSMDKVKPIRGMHYSRGSAATDSTVFAPLANRGTLGSYNEAWDSSTANLQAPYPYKDDGAHASRPSFGDYDPYSGYSGVAQQHADSSYNVNTGGVGMGRSDSPYTTRSYDDLPPVPNSGQPLYDRGSYHSPEYQPPTYQQQPYQGSKYR